MSQLKKPDSLITLVMSFLPLLPIFPHKTVSFAFLFVFPTVTQMEKYCICKKNSFKESFLIVSNLFASNSHLHIIQYFCVPFDSLPKPELQNDATCSMMRGSGNIATSTNICNN